MTEEPALKLEISTLEYYDDRWNLVLTHVFYGNTEKEITQLIESHKKTDSFFKASFEGIFKWKGATIQLKNVYSGIIQT